MISAEKNAQLEKLMDDEEFAMKIANATSFEGMQKVFADAGVDISIGELIEMRDACAELYKEKGIISEDGELSPEMLEYVSGGKWGGWRYLKAAFAFGAAVLAGPSVAGAVLIIGGIAVLAGF